MTPFVVLSMPRSRSFWLSRFLDCEHDPARFFKRRDDVAAYFNRDGARAADTALGLIWMRVAPQLRPDLRVVVVHRPVDAIMASLRRIGLDPYQPHLEKLAARLREIPGHHFSYSQLATKDGCVRLYHACYGEGPLVDHWDAMKDERMECDIPAYIADTEANVDGLRAVFGAAA